MKVMGSTTEIPSFQQVGQSGTLVIAVSLAVEKACEGILASIAVSLRPTP